jgi:hypothetical protein
MIVATERKKQFCSKKKEQLFYSNEVNIAAEHGMMDVEDTDRAEYKEHDEQQGM